MLSLSYKQGYSQSAITSPPITTHTAEIPSKPLTTILVTSTPDDTVEDLLFSYACPTSEGDPIKEKLQVCALPIGLRMIFTTIVLQDEVDNGGLDQFFQNPSGQFANEALEDLKRIGATKHAKILHDAILLHKHDEIIGSKTPTRKSHDRPLSYSEGRMSELDDLFYNCKENLSTLRIRFIRKHPTLFVVNTKLK